MLKSLTESQQRYIEGYSAALQDILLKLTGDNGCGKSYDPMTCDATKMHSYAFDMKDGGRHHLVSEYQSVDEIKQTLLNETVWKIGCTNAYEL